MSEWINTAQAASIAGICASTFKSMEKRDYYGLERHYIDGARSGSKRKYFFNSVQIERAIELRRISGVTLPAAIKVVIAQGGKPPEPWLVPKAKEDHSKVYLSPLKNRLSQIRELVPQKEYNSAIYRYVCELLKICDRLLSELGETNNPTNGQDHKI